MYGWGCYKDKEGKEFFNATSEKQILRKQTRPMRLPGLEHVLEVRAGICRARTLIRSHILCAYIATDPLGGLK